MQHIAICVDE